MRKAATYLVCLIAVSQLLQAQNLPSQKLEVRITDLVMTECRDVGADYRLRFRGQMILKNTGTRPLAVFRGNPINISSVRFFRQPTSEEAAPLFAIDYDTFDSSAAPVRYQPAQFIRIDEGKTHTVAFELELPAHSQQGQTSSPLSPGKYELQVSVLPTPFDLMGKWRTKDRRLIERKLGADLVISADWTDKSPFEFSRRTDAQACKASGSPHQ